MISTAAEFIKEIDSCGAIPERFKWKVIYGKIADMIPVPEKIEEMLKAYWESIIEFRKERIEGAKKYYTDIAKKAGLETLEDWWKKEQRPKEQARCREQGIRWPEDYGNIGKFDAPMFLAHELALQDEEKDFEIWKVNSKIAKIVKKIWKV